MKKRIHRRRLIAVFFLIQFSTQAFFPTFSYALTSGPSQPEFTSFEPVSTTNLVDEFTGDFTYNIPLLEVPGPSGGSYPLSLSYHSGTTPEEEASWVGYGWTLNAGAVNRTVRGLPDDANGDPVQHFNKTPMNWTATLGAGISLEMFSKDPGMFNAGISYSCRYNNYRGFGFTQRLGVILGRGLMDMGYSVDNGSGSFSLSISPMNILKNAIGMGTKSADQKKDKEFSSKDMFRSFARKKATTTLSNLTGSTVGSRYGIFSYNQTSPMATYVPAYNGGSVNVSGAFNADPTPVEVGVGFNLMGSFSWQKNVELTTLPSYGYLYSGAAQTGSLMDFHYEKDNPYDKQDEFIGMPFNDADQYTVTGEGIGGGFRLLAPTVGQFRTAEVKSEYDILQFAPEFEAGLNWGGGVDVGVGVHSLISTDWVVPANNGFSTFSTTATDENYFFRFNNDMGGSWGSKYDDKPIRFKLDNSSNPASSVDFSINNSVRGGRSSYIGFNTNERINDTNDPLKLKRFYKRSSSGNGTVIDRTKNPSAIGELTIQNADGMRYNYGIPVYGKQETNMSFGLDKVPGSAILNNYVSYQKRETETKVGQVKAAPYATSYLVTEILTPDYLDKSDNGPTSDDIGGYVKFGYSKIYGDQAETSGWYKWRIPYNGVLFQRNALSDKRDDMGTLVSGQKEIYYMKSIETKTHVAVFTFSDRTDGKGALDDEAAMTNGAVSSDRLKKLDKVDLYAVAGLSSVTRDANGNIQIPVGSKPLKTAYLVYASSTNELMVGAPNADATRGRLTLQKIYFEYNGLVQAKTSPYFFEYKYPTITYPAPYVSLSNFGSVVSAKPAWTTGTACSGPDDPQNPKYSPYNADAWGNFQMMGCVNYNKMRTWVDQYRNGNIDFDPAPWTLKKIILPSGGEIHVQYEQDDYQYVQDQDAHVMAPLISVGTGADDGKFYLNCKALGIDSSNSAHVDLLRKLIKQRYDGTDKKMYFKLLYKLKGDNSSLPTLSSCNAEYITGYANLVSADVNVAKDAGGLFIKLSGDKLPKATCNEFVKANVIGRINESSDCSRSSDMLAENSDGGGSSKAVSVVKAFAEAVATLTPSSSVFSDGTYCNAVNPALSYLRIPTINPKKGGGIRVKNLIMYDNFVPTAPEMYGNSYSYTTTDAAGRVISSGVATNEPSSMREENILVEFLPKRDQSFANKLIAGNDKEVSEGPLGETVYPGPSVGYSRVLVSNIYTGTTTPGFSMSEFYTAKDFPIAVSKTEIDGTSKIDFQFNIFANKIITTRRALQGFSVVLNNMHGQVKEKSTWAGSPSNTTTASKVSSQQFEYFATGEGLPVMSSLYGAVSLQPLGREVDFTIAQRSIREATTDTNTEVDFTVGFFGLFPIPQLNGMVSATKTDALLNTHATTKVVRYPAVVKKITTYQDGIYHTDEYVAFDAVSGKPVAVKSEDEFKGAYLKQSVPAVWEYPNFSQRATNQNLALTLSGTMKANGAGKYTFTIPSANACTVTSQLASGDLLSISAIGTVGGSTGPLANMYYRIESVDDNGDAIQLLGTRYNLAADFTGTANVTKVEVLQSGRNNQLGQNAGNLTFHDPAKDNMDPADFTDPSRFISTPLTAAIQSFYNSGATTITLTATYTNVNMSAYASHYPACVADWTNVSVKDLIFNKVANGSSFTLVLQSFKVYCDSGSWSPVIDKTAYIL